MQAAATRLPGAARRRRPDNMTAKPHLAFADDSGLLDALPIAAAIIERTAESCLKVAAHNSRFLEAVRRSSCRALDWNEADCLKSGQIADLLDGFFDGTEIAGELDFKDGEGVASQHFRMKLAPLPCAVSSISRTFLRLQISTIFSTSPHAPLM